MTQRENLHRLVDTLPDERLDAVSDYLADLQDGADLSAETTAAIKQGLAAQGRVMTLEDYRRTRGL